ncbi:MAG: hypothetical protein ACLTG4_09875 [Oscillospiraceae bacterium]
MDNYAIELLHITKVFRYRRDDDITLRALARSTPFWARTVPVNRR